MLKLILPTKEYKEELKQFKKNIVKSHSPFHGTGQLESLPIDTWIERCDDYRHGRNLPPGYVPASLFMAIRESDDKIVGLLQIRHSLTEDLLNGRGSIGYMTAYDERLKGYAIEMLRLALAESKKLGLPRVLLTCNKWNVGAKKTILANGGKLQDEISHNGELIQRYWIENT